MICGYCGTRIHEGEHRCRRCGRTPDDTLTGEFTLVHNTGALAAQPVLRAHRVEGQAQTGLKSVSDFRRAVQRPLFQDKAASKVVPIGVYAPPPVRPRPVSEGKAAQKPRRLPRVSDDQASLDFLASDTTATRILATAVPAMIYCEERVASPLHRAFAAMLDASMVLIGYGLFLAAFHSLVAGFVLTRSNILILASVLPLFAFVYGLMWAIAGTDTAGMKWTRLRLTTFEGFPPERRERLLRFVGACLSRCTGGGVIWALADEEGLGWQDHISRTFPTPRRADSQVFHRR